MYFCGCGKFVFCFVVDELGRSWGIEYGGVVVLVVLDCVLDVIE